MGERVQLRRAKGWRMPPDTIKVDRSTPFGNPFRVSSSCSAAECVYLFRLMLGGYLCLSSGPGIEAQRAYREHLDGHIDELSGKNLACWCRARTPCHADVLLDAVRAKESPEGMQAWQLALSSARNPALEKRRAR